MAVPTHFYKVIVADQGRPSEIPSVAGFVLPNNVIDNNTKLTDFLVPIDAIERASGLDFLPRLPPTARKELCRETQCSIIVRFFDDDKKQKSLPAPKQNPALPAPNEPKKQDKWWL